MATYVVSDTQMQNIATAIRNRSGHQNPLFFPNDFISEITYMPAIPDIQDDGKAHFVISINPYVSPSTRTFSLLVDDGDGQSTWSAAATVDWGDGTTEAITDSNRITHTFQQSGNYDITIKVTQGSLTITAGHTTARPSYESTYLTQMLIYDPLININTAIQCYGLIKAILPHQTRVYGDMFENCYALEKVEFGGGYATIGSSAFQNCKKLQALVIPENTTNLGYHPFEGASALAYLDLPSTLTALSSAFYSMGTLFSEMHVRAEIPPTTTYNIGNYIRDDCVIYVPANSISAYEADTYWGTAAGHYMAEPT